ncbi:MAG: hypothetical protein ACJAX4_000713 [Clostridium sp.]|jgi:hypothetical protein
MQKLEKYGILEVGQLNSMIFKQTNFLIIHDQYLKRKISRGGIKWTS